MFVPGVREDSTVVDVRFNFVELAEEIFHDFLCNIWRLRDSHWEAIVSEVAEWCANSAQIFARFIEFKCVIMHRQVNFAKKLVTWSTIEDVLNLRKIVDFALDALVEFVEIRDPSNSTVCLWIDEGW